MAGIYVHIPFCRSKCGYCNFFSVVSKRNIIPVVDAIKKELKLTSNFFHQQPITSIYFGGGTPSFIQPTLIANILDTIKQLHHIEHDAEITLEANPDDITKDNIDIWTSSGINRISLGVQSFRQQDLDTLNRKHNSETAIQALTLLADAFLKSWTADLIFNTPEESGETVIQNIKHLINYNVPHISCYSLTVEENTPLYKNIKSGKISLPNEDLFVKHFLLIMDTLKAAGYNQYEISNFALPGHTAVHNSSYWSGEPYLGIGPAAHSFKKNFRVKNPSSISSYLSEISKNRLPGEIEPLSTVDKLNEYIMTRLRLARGISIKEAEKLFGKKIVGTLKLSVKPWIELKHIVIDNDSIKLTESGILISDTITSDLFTA